MARTFICESSMARAPTYPKLPHELVNFVTHVWGAYLFSKLLVSGFQMSIVLTLESHYALVV